MQSEQPDIRKIDLDSPLEDWSPITEALGRAARKAILQHRRNGIPLVYSDNGTVTLVPADQVPID